MKSIENSWAENGNQMRTDASVVPHQKIKQNSKLKHTYTHIPFK